jgi:cytochrome P450
MGFRVLVSEAAIVMQDRLAAAAICITVLLSTWIVCMKIHKFNNKMAKKLPPGPPGLPIIGHLHMLGNLPHRNLGLLSQKYGSLMSLRLGSVPTVIVSSAEMAQQFLKTHDHVFSSRPAIRSSKYMVYDARDVFFSRYGNNWRQLRRICVSELLSPKRLESFRFQREEEVSLMIHSLVGECARVSNPVVDFSKTVSNVAVNIMCRMIFGRKYSDEEAYDSSGFREMIQEFASMLGVFDIGDFIPYLGWMDLQGLGRRQKEIHKRADAFYEKLIEDHLVQKNMRQTKDFVDVLLALSQQNSAEVNISRDNIKAILIDMFHAGSDAPYTALEWAMSELLRRPLVMKKAQEELEKVVGLNYKVRESDLPHLSYLQAVVKETLRLYPPAPLMVPHESMESCAISDYEIPARTRVIINSWAIGRNPKSWEDAEEFNPERFMQGPSSCVDVRGQDFQLIPFGSGRRGCPGMQLGMVIVEIVLAQLLHCFDWRLPDGIQGPDLDMNEKFGLTVPRAVNLLAVPSPRLTALALGCTY